MVSTQDTTRKSTSSFKAQVVLFACAIVIAFFLFNLLEYGTLKPLEMAHKLSARRNILYAAGYLGTYATAVAAIVVSVFSRSAIARWLALVGIFGFLSLEVCCRLLLGTNIGFAEVETGLSEMSFAGEFMSSYTASLTKALVVGGIVTAALFSAVHWLRVRFSRWWLTLVPVSAAMIFAVLWKTIAVADVYPSPLRIPVLAAYASINTLDAGPRDPVEIAHHDVPKPRVFIFLMDESIRGDRLSINGWSRKTTPYLESTADQYLNFGIACSASNISSSSNLIVRAGLRADELPDTAQRGLKTPSIFQYAKAAGYRTCYLDGQYAPGVMANFMSSYDFDHIDVAYWAIADEPDPNKKYRRDRLLLEKMRDVLADGKPTFFWVNKYGAHFHYDRTYPDEARIFTPIMPDGSPIDACALEEIENSYANSMLWSVDGFLETLLADVNLDDTVVLYTSDHGQSFKEGNGLSTHADRSDPPPTQANVPLVGWGRLFATRFPDGVMHARGRADHFQLFPTMLVLMGYDEAEVTSRYGQPLWGPPPTARVFLSGDVFGRGIVHLNAYDNAEQSVEAAIDGN